MALFRLLHGTFPLYDIWGEMREARELLVNTLTIVGGRPLEPLPPQPAGAVGAGPDLARAQKPFTEQQETLRDRGHSRRRCERPPRPRRTRLRPEGDMSRRSDLLDEAACRHGPAAGGLAALDDRHRVREVDRRADVVRDDRDAVADRARPRPAGRSRRRAPRSGATTSQSSWPQIRAERRRRVGDEHAVRGEDLRAGVDDDPVRCRPRDDGRDRERSEVGVAARALRDLAAVVEDVRARAVPRSRRGMRIAKRNVPADPTETTGAGSPRARIASAVSTAAAHASRVSRSFSAGSRACV